MPRLSASAMRRPMSGAFFIGRPLRGGLSVAKFRCFFGFFLCTKVGIYGIIKLIYSNKK